MGPKYNKCPYQKRNAGKKESHMNTEAEIEVMLT